MLQEIQLLKRISHDRTIVQFYGACLETKPPMLIMEYMGVRRALMFLGLASEMASESDAYLSAWRSSAYAQLLCHSPHDGVGSNLCNNTSHSLNMASPAKLHEDSALISNHSMGCHKALR